MEDRIGNQIPSQSVILPYFETHGPEAVELYEKSGTTLLEWQKLMLNHILAYNDEGLFIHQKFGMAIPRRNGKSEVSLAIMVYALKEGLRVVYTAHRTSTSTSLWERLVRVLSKMGYVEDKSFKTGKRVGAEKVVLNETGGEVHFRTRTNNGGLGEGFDIFIVDEAQEYTTDQDSALKYTVSSSPNPLTFMIGTPPTVKSGGTVFSQFRKTVLSGESVDCGWAEWSVREMHDPHDKEYWYETNPSLGSILKERVIQAEITDGEDLDFNIQRLGYWVRYNIKSAITKEEWLQCQYKPSIPECSPQVYVGIKFGHDATNVSMSFATKVNGKIFVECIGCRPIREGSQWIIKYLKAVNPSEVVIDGASGQKLLEQELTALGIARNAIVLPTVKEIIVANSMLESAITSHTICHNNQPSVTAVMTNCEHRAIGTNGGYGYQAIKDGLEIAILDSIVLAHWSCSKGKEKKSQRVSF